MAISSIELRLLNTLNVLRKYILGWEVNETGSRSCPVVTSVIDGVESPGFTTTELV
jgi:hypothetical protein